MNTSEKIDGLNVRIYKLDRRIDAAERREPINHTRLAWNNRHNAIMRLQATKEKLHVKRALAIRSLSTELQAELTDNVLRNKVAE